MILLVAMVACCVHRPADPPPPGVVEDEAGVGEASSRDLMVRALSLRDAGPTCAEVEAIADDPVQDLLWMAGNIAHPPWVAMRAAECLVVGHAAEVQPTLNAWVSAADTWGLALIVLGHLDEMPEGVALSVARLAMERGPQPDEAAERIAESSHDAVRALVETTDMTKDIE